MMTWLAGRPRHSRAGSAAWEQGVCGGMLAGGWDRATVGDGERRGIAEQRKSLFRQMRLRRKLGPWLVGRGILVVATSACLSAGDAMAVPPPGTPVPDDPPWVILPDTRFAPEDTGPPPVGLGSVSGSTTTGADDCADVAVTPLLVGSPGNPTTVTVFSAAYAMTGVDCDGSLGEVWWEAFSLDRCARVTIDFCGSFPRRLDSFTLLATACAEAGGSCRPYVSADDVGGGCPGGEGDPNPVMTFYALPPGTYYYPLKCHSANPTTKECASYAMNISAEECSGDCSGCFGACCDTVNRTCVDGASGSDCLGPTQKFTFRGECCSVECRPAVTDYDAYGVKLRKHFPVSAFPLESAEDVRANDCWGYVSPSGREYAILGLRYGTGFVEITDPDNAYIVAETPDAYSIWSDMQTYDHYCYNVNETGGGVQIIDLSAIDDGAVPVIGSARGGMNTAHDLEIDPVSGFLYPCGTDIVRGFLAFDLAEPADPAPVGSWNEVYVHDLYVQTYESCPYAGRSGRCEIAFAFCGGAGFKVIDVTNKQDMRTIATLLYPNLSYSHQGWPSSDLSYIFMDDEFDESSHGLTATTYVLDVRDAANPTYVTTFTTGWCSIDHNLMVRDSLVFEANYTTGLRVFDVSDVHNAIAAAHFDTYPQDNALGFRGAWGVYSDFPSGNVILSDISRGLFVFTLCDDLPEPRADFNGDGRVDLRDVARLQECFGRGASDAFCDPVDIDCDREVDSDDAARMTAELTGP